MASDPYAVYDDRQRTHAYHDSGEPVYNPYSFTAGPPEHSYDPPLNDDSHYTGYRDDAFVPPVLSTPGEEKALPDPSRNTSYTMAPVVRDRSVRSWREDEHKGLWTKGSRVRCFGRFFCCSVMTFVILLASIIATLALWIRPPDVTFNNVNFKDVDSKVSVVGTSFSIPLTLNISIDNPNYIGVTFDNISAVATYPGTDVGVGGGFLTHVKFPSDTTTFLNFPFNVTYSVGNDPNLVVLKDLANKCTGSQDLTVDYELTLKIRILALITPHFHSTATFACPLTADEIKSIGGNLLGGS